MKPNPRIKPKIMLYLTLCIAASTPWLSGCQSASQSSASESEQQAQSSSQSPGKPPNTSASPLPDSQSSPPSSSGSSSASRASSGSEPVETQDQSEAVTGGTSANAQDDELNGDEIGALDQQLDESFAEFDGMILEQQASATTLGVPFDEQSGDSGTDGAADDEALFEEGDLYEGLPGYGENPDDEDAANGDGGNSTTENASTEKNSATQTASSGGGAGSGSGAVPADISNGSDDDIVARQIREAAMKEKDPVLREKLWDEYRKYKKQ
ncbi:MAG: hypothetical protein KBT63_11680 [Porticoccaceae bacterium]|nr:hypothetical protein [Porticoccaceae bacterium]